MLQLIKKLKYISLLLFVFISFSFTNYPNKKNNTLNKILINNKEVNISNAMKHYKVPAISISVIENNKIDWLYSYGYISENNKTKINEETLFQFGSISKAVTALAVVKLVDNGILELDKDVSSSLKGWKIEKPVQFINPEITLASLLSMTSGIGISGFYGYSPNEKLPTLIEILNGQSPANNLPVKLEELPSEKYSYSGGGYQIVELLIESVTNKSFQSVLNEEIFKPLNLKNSFFQAPLNSDLSINAVHSYNEEGKPFSYPWRLVPEFASAGLWSTPADISQILIEIMKAYQNKKSLFSNLNIKKALTKQKNTQYGLGFVISGTNDKLRIAKLGQNAGYQGWIVAYPSKGQGAVIITNSDNGRELAQDIISSIAKNYDWPSNEKLADAWMLK
ncbi:MAG: class A beta-lactamase-related serine hydrolase [Spirobacillus cienkowskii]|jgi:CubicO group peptidase (beta-lactamase class C family)|uniref:Class A beta-lactamase-related serine hydrolase n=1 Tax=Spirobacillus cienkowskii TaxID=495820 RepID=A0A369KYF7_9BACT|nr:MAG: class A beta-lactamase-related serine hydrolase [Spirobacillus cienkowskii]